MDNYHHPYDAYPIQRQFMDAVYDLLHNGYKIGIFESPTGTGKTLSLICSSLSWLRYSGDVVESGAAQEEADGDDDEPAWVKASFEEMQKKKKFKESAEYEKRLDELAKNPKLKQVTELKAGGFTKRAKVRIEVAIEAEDGQFVPEDYHSEEESEGNGQLKTLENRNNALNQEIKQLMNQMNSKEIDEKVLKKSTKIYFSSRTHSQLNQFSSQLRLPNFPSTIPNSSEHLKYTPLGSRKQLCINPNVKKFKDVNLINDACLDLQKKDANNCCKYYPKDNNSSNEFKDAIFAQIHDIEDLSKIGEFYQVCPYYAIRQNIPNSEVITLPYQLLISKTSRDAIGVDLKNSIVIIDEAHNLLDTISSIYSVSVTKQEFEKCKKSLKLYLSKFQKRLNGGNRVNLLKLIKIIDILVKFVNSCEKEGKIASGKAIELTDIFNGTTGDLLNIHKLDKYLTVSKIAYKIESYMERKDDKSNDDKKSGSSTPLLFKVIQFLKSLNNPSREGKFFFDIQNSISSMNYMLLDPSSVFKEIVEDCKCVILAGGTMEPVEDYTNYLFPYVDSKLVKKFSCGHVIPTENLKVFQINKSINRTKEFEFSFDKRNDVAMVNELGKTLIELVKNIPNGVVVFVQSYKYQQQLIDQWKKSEIWNELNGVKKVFTENSQSSAEDVLQQYTKEISNKSKSSNGGAILISVVGGKLSEGINFSDELARSVIMIGLPFPNAFSGEIISKKKYIEDDVLKKTDGNHQLANEATKNFYENLCMRSVNQSVGRAIRHANDFACIYLIDKRYLNDRIVNKLSGWIRERVEGEKAFPTVLQETQQFFKLHN